METIDQLAEKLRDTSIPWNIRLKDLLNSRGLKFSNLAWLGEVLKDTLSVKDEVNFKVEALRLDRLIESWRSKNSN